MNTYKAYLIQAGQGCDYTIACGRTVISIAANSIEEATQQLVELIKGEYSCDEYRLQSAEIYEIGQFVNVNVKSIYSQLENDRKRGVIEQIEENERKEFERLKAKYM